MWPMETETLISMSAASKLYNVSRKTIERLIKRGEVPYHRIGRQIRISPNDLLRATGKGAEPRQPVKSEKPSVRGRSNLRAGA
jgi:excisionase family DNA binding protein